MPESRSVLPDAFNVADSLSLRAQRRTLLGTSSRLLLTVVAALALALAPLWHHELLSREEGEILALVAAGLFLAALVVESWLLRRRPERDWYDGRAVAESAKTLTWRYAVGGLPYPVGQDAADSLDRDMRSLATDVPQLEAAVSAAPASVPWMGQLRSSGLDERRTTYLKERIGDQAQWYQRKSVYNTVRARWWTVALIVLEALGVLLALMKGLALIEIDLASLASALIGCGAAWLAVKQHESVGTAYLLAGRELDAVRRRLERVDDEAQWAVEVADAEEAISREHTMWRASRSLPDPAPGYGHSGHRQM